MCFLSHIFLLSLYNWLEHLYCIAFGVFLGITFDAHPHSGWFFCLAPNGARRTESHIIIPSARNKSVSSTFLTAESFNIYWISLIVSIVFIFSIILVVLCKIQFSINLNRPCYSTSSDTNQKRSCHYRGQWYWPWHRFQSHCRFLVIQWWW